MELLVLFLRIGLASILLTSAYTKIKEMAGHIESIRNYRILPSKLVKTAGYVDVTVELLLGTCILVGLLFNGSVAISILLIGTYTLAIVINLKRGRTDLSCGCGGIVGENLLSWRLVLRNVGIMIGASLLFFSQVDLGMLDAVLSGKSIRDVYPESFFIAFCGGWVTLICIIIVREVTTLRKHFKRLLA